MVKGNKKPTLIGALLGLLVVLSISTKTVRGDYFSCPNVQLRIGTCGVYLIGKSPITDYCCIAYRDLNKEANTPEKRKELCNCFKHMATIFEFLKKRGDALPTLCKVPNPVPISPDSDCSKSN